jgi:hypothetical protein
MRTKTVTLSRASASFSTAASHQSFVTLPCPPWETPTERAAETLVEAGDRASDGKRRDPRHIGAYKRGRGGDGHGE